MESLNTTTSTVTSLTTNVPTYKIQDGKFVLHATKQICFNITPFSVSVGLLTEGCSTVTNADAHLFYNLKNHDTKLPHDLTPPDSGNLIFCKIYIPWYSEIVCLNYTWEFIVRFGPELLDLMRSSWPWSWSYSPISEQHYLDMQLLEDSLSAIRHKVQVNPNKEPLTIGKWLLLVPLKSFHF